MIEPTKGPLPPRLDELWGYREVFGFLVWRDIKVRYAQTVLGGAWMVFQPLAMMLVYTFAFSHLAKVAIPGTPYPLFALSGLTLWIFVSRGLIMGSESLVSNIQLVTKTSCPRLLIPLAAVVSVFVDFLVALVLFLVIAAAYGRYPTWHFVFVPLILLMAFVLTLGLSLLLWQRTSATGTWDRRCRSSSSSGSSSARSPTCYGRPGTRGRRSCRR